MQMNLLQYTSNEMFSSTELIRKSKMVFDKLSHKEIEKAIILRDGKPSFMLLDFQMYEELISDYIKTKEELEKIKNKKTTKVSNNIIENKNIVEDKVEEKIEIKEEKEIIKEEKKIENIDDIENLDLEAALAKIEQLDVSDFNKENIEIKKDPQLKDFWE